MIYQKLQIEALSCVEFPDTVWAAPVCLCPCIKPLSWLSLKCSISTRIRAAGKIWWTEEDNVFFSLEGKRLRMVGKFLITLLKYIVLPGPHLSAAPLTLTCQLSQHKLKGAIWDRNALFAMTHNKNGTKVNFMAELDSALMFAVVLSGSTAFSANFLDFLFS